jgi:hypothetical protein
MGAVLAVLTLLPVGRAAAVDAITQKKIDAAIRLGVAYLAKMQDAKTGLWEFPQNKADETKVAADTDVGATALAALTLLECGSQPSDPRVQNAAKWIREKTVTATYTYSISLAILFLDRLGDPRDIPLIESMTVKLLAGECKWGGWLYHCPAIPEAEMRRLIDHARKHNEMIAKGELPKTRIRRRTLKDVHPNILKQLEIIRNAELTDRQGDNSNTQFVAMALWVARRHGLPTHEALERVASIGRSGMVPGYGWTYRCVRNGAALAGGITRPNTTRTMTCSGLLQLALGPALLNQAALGEGSKAVLDWRQDGHILDAMKTLGKYLALPASGGTSQTDEAREEEGKLYYFLWSLERVGVLYEVPRFGNKDWYDLGSKILLEKQAGDGSWQGKYGSGGVDTCFALLFLRRANLFKDWTAYLKGRKPSKSQLDSGGLGGGELIKRGGGVPDIKGKKVPKGNGDVVAKPKPAETTAEEQQAEINRLSKELLDATGEKQEDLVRSLENGRGVVYTEALAGAIPQLKGDVKEKARAALTKRLKRLKPESLALKLKPDESLEVRRAAALACALKPAKALIPNLIEMLEDSELPVAEAAYSSLKDLSGKDFGPDSNATKSERKAAARKWQAWWKNQPKD